MPEIKLTQKGTNDFQHFNYYLHTGGAATTVKAVAVKSVNGFKAYDQCIILLLTRVALGLSITFMCYGVKKWPL